MKVKVIKELNRTNLQIETGIFYQEEYQIEMLRRNEILGLLKTECHQINNESHFSYDISNMQSLKKKYEVLELRYQDIYNLIKSLIVTVEEIQSYLLEPESLVLDPNLIYLDNEEWKFLFLPIKRSNLGKTFHELTEYFVKTLDYKEIEGIQFASFLHKETLQENFNLEQIFKKYEANKGEPEVEKTRTQKKESLISEFDRMEDSFIRDTHSSYNNHEIIKEKKSKFFLFGKGKERSKVRFSKGRWGDWEDFIIDNDRQRKESGL
jgi:hypothetical protein